MGGLVSFMKVTLDHPFSSYGMPVIVSDDGKLLDYWCGIKAVRKKLSFSTQDLANACGISRRTVEGWEQGRMPTAAALNVMGQMLRGLPASRK